MLMPEGQSADNADNADAMPEGQSADNADAMPEGQSVGVGGRSNTPHHAPHQSSLTGHKFTMTMIITSLAGPITESTVPTETETETEKHARGGKTWDGVSRPGRTV